MKTNRQLPAWGTLLFLLTLLSNAARAQVFIEELQQAELPLALIPDTRRKIVLGISDGLESGTNADIVGGYAVSGHYRISSDTNQTISINVLASDDDPHILLQSFKIQYQGRTYKKLPVVGLPSPGEGEDLFVGFTAVLRVGAGEGERFLSYTIDVLEE